MNKALVCNREQHMQRPCGRKEQEERSKRRIQINLGISLALSSLSLMFMDNLELTAIDRFLGEFILWNKLHSLHDTKIVFQMIPSFPPQKVSLPYNQAMKRAWKVIYPVFFIFKTLRKSRNLINIVILPIVFQSKVWQLLSTLRWWKRIFFER